MARCKPSDLRDIARDATETAAVLARLILAVMPVVRAAEEWRDRGPGQSHCDEEDCPCTSTVCRLKSAVEQMRAQMEAV